MVRTDEHKEKIRQSTIAYYEKVKSGEIKRSRNKSGKKDLHIISMVGLI